jgi:uncharacterized protein YecT (DUF1311 family)
MRARTLSLLASVVLLGGCTHAGNATKAEPTAAPSARPTTPVTLSPTRVRPSLPVLHERFDLLPCDQNTDQGMEGCAEHDILAADAKVDRLVRQLWAADDDQGRGLLVDAQRTWVAYRRAACLSDSDAFRDGSQSPIEFGYCVASLTNERARFLVEQLALRH